MSTATIPERVSAGAAFLDEMDPDWWRADVERAIDLDRLAMRATDRCVLGQRCPVPVLAAYIGVDVTLFDMPGEIGNSDWGQAYKAYANHLRGGGGDWETLAEWAADHGFNDFDDEFPALTAEWRKVITERRATAEANCAHVRKLLAQRQPRFATALEAAAGRVSDAMTLHGTDWLHAAHRAEVEAAVRRLDAALTSRGMQ